MAMASDVGWTVKGYEPNGTLASAARKRGFDVRTGWRLKTAFEGEQFDAVTLIDVLSYAWSPLEMLQDVYQLLAPDGVLAMRVTNKRVVLGLVRRLFRFSASRNARLSRLLQGHFHTIGLHALTEILQNIGFHLITVDSRAELSIDGQTHRITRLAYRIAELLYLASASNVNFYPGVLVFGSKR
jgi:SAM-dependent methyltransferase